MDEARPPAQASNAVTRIALPSQDEDIATHPPQHRREADLCGRQGPDRSERSGLVRGDGAGSSRPYRRALDADHAQHVHAGRKRVYYLSLEFLIGRLLYDSLNNLGLTEQVRAALGELGVDLERLRRIEPDAALGNGGLGRLAACFMESMATLSIAAYGYGIRYNHGSVPPGHQGRLAARIPRELAQLRQSVGVRAAPKSPTPSGSGARSMRSPNLRDGTRHVWTPAETVMAIAYDTPVVGWRGRHVNTLRLWSARAPDPIHLEEFNRGDHVGALQTRARANAISQILYPSDEIPGRAGIAPASGVFLLLRLVAGPRTPPRAASTATSGRCPTRRRSSSTTRTPRSPSPNSCGSWSICTMSRGPKRGTSRAPRSPTRTTRSCRKRWKLGRCR